jgi:hypothetical protein
MSELEERQRFKKAMPGYKIRSCLKLDGHYIYEAYRSGETPYGENVPMDPYYYVKDDGNVNQIKVGLDPGKFFSAKIIWENPMF